MRYQFMLAKSGDKTLLEKSSPKWSFEPLFNGIRILICKEANDIELINKKEKDIIYRYPELLDIPLNIRAKQCVLDAELVVLDKEGKPDFNLLQKREQVNNKKVIDAGSKEIPATLFVFDILEKDGQNIIEMRLKDRREELGKIIADSAIIRLSPSNLNGKALLKQVQEQGMEGIMAKDLSSKYEQGKRSWQWLKINF